MLDDEIKHLKEDEANAHLIAAAPDMYETLEQARQDINWMLNNQQFLNPDRFAYIDKTLAKMEMATIVQSIEIRMLTADELRRIAAIMDNENLPEGTEHNPKMHIRNKMFTTPEGKVTLEVYFIKRQAE